MREAFSRLRARVFLLIAIAFALMLGITVYHEFGERWFVVSLLVASASIALACGAVWLHSASLFLRRIGTLAPAAKQPGKGTPATRAGTGAGGDELGEPAQSLDRLAQELQTKEAQLSGTVRALRVLSAANCTLLNEKGGEQHLLEAMCRAIGQAGGYRMVWAGYAVCDIERSIRPVARWGIVADGCLENVQFTWSEIESRQTPSGRAIRSRVPVVVRDIQKETSQQAWKDYALRCGCGSWLALPLRIGERVIGMLNVCAEEPDAFGDEELRVLSESADDLSFGIAHQRAKVEQACVKRALEHFEEQYRATKSLTPTPTGSGLVLTPRF